MTYNNRAKAAATSIERYGVRVTSQSKMICHFTFGYAIIMMTLNIGPIYSLRICMMEKNIITTPILGLAID